MSKLAYLYLNTISGVVLETEICKKIIGTRGGKFSIQTKHVFIHGMSEFRGPLTNESSFPEEIIKGSISFFFKSITTDKSPFSASCYRFVFACHLQP